MYGTVFEDDEDFVHKIEWTEKYQTNCVTPKVHKSS